MSSRLEDGKAVGSLKPRKDLSPSAILTPRALVARLRELSGERRAPIGERAIRRAVRAGHLRAARIGNRDLIQWSDYLAWYGSLIPEPVALPPDRAAQIEADVTATIRRERERGINSGRVRRRRARPAPPTDL